MQKEEVEFLKSDEEAKSQRGQLGFFKILNAKCPGFRMHEGGTVHLDQKLPQNIFLADD